MGDEGDGGEASQWPLFKTVFDISKWETSEYFDENPTMFLH